MAQQLAARRLLILCAAGIVASLILVAGAQAQTGVNDAYVPGAAAPTAKAQAPAQKKAAAPGGAPTDGGLRERVEQLEAQLIDLQVVIGTLESLARSGGPRPAPSMQSGGFGGGDQGRLEGVEMQIRALTAQVEQLAQEVRAGAVPGRRSDASEPGFGETGFAATGGDAGYAEPPPRFGSTTVTSDSLDPIGVPNAGGQRAAPAPSAGAQMAALDPVGENPKEVYEMAYGYLLQQDYASAQSGFSEFLKRFPQDRMAPDALYWLGEVHYVQRNYADAAEAFDLVVSSYGKSNKAADAQLKRGMSLAQLGRKQEACTVWRDVSAKFPSAPAHVKAKAESERQRAGCS